MLTDTMSGPGAAQTAPAPTDPWMRGVDVAQATRLCSVPGCERPHDARGLCTSHYHQMRKVTPVLPPVVRPSTVERFMAKVDVNGPNGCWLWLAAKGTRGRYGLFGVGRRSNGQPRILRAHRWAYEYWVGPLADGECALHRCDNDKCVNPEHLFKGTQLDNIADMVAKGRHNTVRGSANGMAKLTDREVIEIRQRYAAGGITQERLAADYGVTQTCVSGIVRRKTHFGVS